MVLETIVMGRILGEKFFNRDTKIVAKDLLGKFLIRQIGDKKITVMITETEAYDGFNDKASHAHKGKTKRNEIMFGDPGTFYVYFTYGMYFMLNIVTREKDYPAAVLIRGTNEVLGPGRLTKFLKINKKFNNQKSAIATGLWIEDRPARNALRSKAGGGVKPYKFKIKKTARIGVGYAGPIWSAKKMRFVYEPGE